MISPTTFIGPDYNGQEKRAPTIKISRNETPSHTPTCYLSDLKLDVSKSFQAFDPFEEHYLDDGIQGHCETRFQILFVQLLIIAGCELEFNMRGALDEAVKGGSLGAEGTVQAHATLIPTLVCHFRGDRRNQIIFGRGGYYFKTWNTTTTLPEDCNKVDSFLEGATVDHGLSLRKIIVSLYNEVSQDEITPDDAFEKFLDYFLLALDKAESKYEQPQNSKKYPLALLTVDFYRQVAESYKSLIQNEPLSNHPYFRERKTHKTRKRFLADMQIQRAYAAYKLAAKNYFSTIWTEPKDKFFALRAFLVYRVITSSNEPLPGQLLEMRYTSTTQKYALIALSYRKIHTLAVNILRRGEQKPYYDAHQNNDCRKARAFPLGKMIDRFVRAPKGGLIKNTHSVAALVLDFVDFEEAYLEEIHYRALMKKRDFSHMKFMEDSLSSKTLIGHLKKMNRSEELVEAAEDVLEALANNNFR